MVPAGSQITPEGTPNMTAARGPEPSAAGRSAIHGPAQAKPAGSPIGTSPRPRPASHARRSSSPSGTSAVGTPITVATHAARVERSVWLGIDFRLVAPGHHDPGLVGQDDHLDAVAQAELHQHA